MTPLIKRIYEPAEPSDGARFLVDRLWPRGVSKERAELTAWLKDIAPSNALRIQFHKAGDDDADWAAFLLGYRAELDANGSGVAAAQAELDKAAADGPVTLLFGAHNQQRNNAVALAEWLSDRKE